MKSFGKVYPTTSSSGSFRRRRGQGQGAMAFLKTPHKITRIAKYFIENIKIENIKNSGEKNYHVKAKDMNEQRLCQTDLLNPDS